ncbi:MAG: LytTR family transcriptional regulator DNA-binding domain-containing protein [Spirosomataceae bacterium]
MNTALFGHQQVNSIESIVKKGDGWYYSRDERSFEEKTESLPNLTDFLSQNNHFVRVNSGSIINLSHSSGCIFNEQGGFIIVSDKVYSISKKYLLNVKKAYHKYLISKYHIDASNTDKVYPTNNVEKSIIFKKVDLSTAKYFIRTGIITKIYFENGTEKHYYETLKYFESLFDNTTPFVRISRNCIANINYIDDFSINSKAKLGEVIIGNVKLSISRRQLTTFKRKVRQVTGHYKKK